MFITNEVLHGCTYQAFERLIARLLIHQGYKGVRVVGGSGDRGADILAVNKLGKRCLVQAKRWKSRVGRRELERTVEAGRHYGAEITIVVGLSGFAGDAQAYRLAIMGQGHNMTLWTGGDLIDQCQRLKAEAVARPPLGDYQRRAIEAVSNMLVTGTPRKAFVVMATGLGKTFMAVEAIRRASCERRRRVLVLAHTNNLVLQLEKAFWPSLSPTDTTVVWSQHEKPDSDALNGAAFIFGSRDTVANFLRDGNELAPLDLVVIDECHHAHIASVNYSAIIKVLHAGEDHGPQLLGLTATPFLADNGADIRPHFGDNPLVTVDMVYGLRHGFLSRVDYRMFVDNINWDALTLIDGKTLSPRSINRHFFITEWDDAVVQRIREAFNEVASPRAVVFCGTIAHAAVVRDRINALGFGHAEMLHSGSFKGATMTQYDRNLALSKFEVGEIDIICTVDMFNEGIDVPDINIVVFNRVTHSRRIFVQQLGRGLRIAEGKSKTIVLDFAQDIRRYAAGLNLKGKLAKPVPGSTVTIGNEVTFRNATGEDPRAESFLRSWLDDVERIEALGDDEVGVLKFPPTLPD